MHLRRTVLAAAATILALGPAAAGTPAAGQAACADSGTVEAGFARLWDGVSEPTDAGWTQSGPGSFEVTGDGDGGCMLRSSGGLGLLWYSAQTFTDFELRLQWRNEDATDNSGVFVRFPAAGSNTHNIAISQGYEVQIREGTIGDGEDQKTGSVYDEQRELARNANPPGEWNDYSITVETPEGPDGPLPPRITVRLNGMVVNSFQATDANRAIGSGHVGLQNHGDDDAISFRNIRIRNLVDDRAPQTSHRISTDAGRTSTGWYEGPVDVALEATDEFGGSGVARTEYRIDGGGWQTFGHPEEVIFDGTRESFEQWRQVGSGSFALLPDGSMHSVGGLGMLWYPVEYGDVALRFQWRDARPAATGDSNSGVFVRFPDPEEAAGRSADERHDCQTGSGETDPAWVAIYCGQEIQIYDGEGGDAQKTGSVYNFAPLTLDEARPTTQGEWNDYEVRVEGDGDYLVTIIRNGEVINTWRNTPGQTSSRDGDPPTGDRQFARGYIGLQNHSLADHVQIRDVRVKPLGEAEPIHIAEPGPHTLEYRSVDGAGNVEDTRVVDVNIDGRPPTTTATVERGGDGSATVTLTADDDGSGVARTVYRVDGGSWQPYEAPEEPILDHTRASFEQWRQVGAGSFEPRPDGSIVSRGGLGMLWYPVKAFGDAVLSFEWRDVRTDGGASNSGVFMRFPDPEEAVQRPDGEQHDCQTGSATSDPAWVAIYCGHEYQIYDGETGESQKTGSVYNFQPLGLQDAEPTPPGEWNTYAVRTVGDGSYTATVLRNGEIINTFTNAPGHASSRSGDPPTDDRQFARGYVGIQNHGDADVVQIRDVRIRDLSPEAAAFTISDAGTHAVEFRSVDAAGHVEPVRSVTVTVS